MEDRDPVADARMANAPALLQYLPRILLYPVSGHALPAMLMLTAMLWIGTQSIFGIALFAIAAPWVFHYAEAVIDRTALGQATPPQFGGDMIYLGGIAALRPLVGVVLIVTGWYAARLHGPGAQLAVLVTGALLFPAFMLVVAVENSLVAALNPVKLVLAIVGVGWIYLAVCAVLALAAAAIVAFANPAALFTSLFVTIYLLLMTFHLLGYVAYHRAGRLGLSVKAPAPTDESRRMDEQNARLAAVVARLDEALQRNDVAAAGRALYAEPGGPADLRLFHEELFELVQRRRNVELIHAQGQRLISQLLREKRVARALDIAESCYDAHKDFGPEHPEQAVTLAEGALQARREGLFQRLTRDAAVRYANDPAAVTLAFLTARYWCDVKRDDARAKEILKPLLAEASHPRYRQIAAYAKALGA